MPSDQDAINYLRRGLAGGIPENELRKVLIQAGYDLTAPMTAPSVPSTPEPPSAGQMEAETAVKEFRAGQKRDFRAALLTGAGAMTGGLAGEAIGAAIPVAARTAPLLIRLASGAIRAIPEVAGEYAGTYTGGRAAGLSPEEARSTAKYSAGAGLAGRTIARVGTHIAGYMAGLRPATVQAGIENPGLLRAPAADAELTQARALSSQLERQAATPTPGHAAFETMLAAKANKRVNGGDILDIFQKNITKHDNRAARTADQEVRTMAEKFFYRLSPDNSISLGQLDDYIRQEFTKPLVQQYARESEAVAAKRMMAVRQGLAEYLYRQVGPGAAPAQALAKRALTVREAAQNVFDLGPEARPSGTAAERIRGILGDSGEAQKNRAVLTAYDDQYGTKHLADATRLAQQQEWQGRDLETAYAVDSILQPSRPGFVRGVALPVARGGARITRVAGPVSAGVTAGTLAERKRRKKP